MSRVAQVAAARIAPFIAPRVSPIVLYHSTFSSVPAELGELVHNVHPDVFEQQVDWLAGQFEMLSVDDWFAAGGPTGSACITFDDGYLSVFDEALPRLIERGIPSTVFLNGCSLRGELFWRDRVVHIVNQGLTGEFLASEPARAAGLGDIDVDRFYDLSRKPERSSRAVDQALDAFLRDTGRLGDIGRHTVHRGDQLIDHPLVSYGCHTFRHYVPSSLTVEEQQEELVENARVLDDLDVRRSRVFSIPFGGTSTVDEHTPDLLRAQGFVGVLFSRNAVNFDRPRTLDGIPAAERYMAPPDLVGLQERHVRLGVLEPDAGVRRVARRSRDLLGEGRRGAGLALQGTRAAARVAGVDQFAATTPKRRPPALVAEVIADWPGVQQLESAWRELIATVEDPSVFLDFDWAACWWEAYGADAHPLVITTRASADGPLLGLAPFVVTRDPGSSRIRRIRCIGQDPTYGEYLDLLARPGREPAVADAVADQLCGPLRRDWDVVALQRVRDDSVVAGPFAAALSRRGAALSMTPTAPSPYLPLRTESGTRTFEEILAERSSNFRRQYRHASNRLAKAGEVDVVVAEPGTDASLTFDEGFSELLRLHTERWSTSGTFDDDVFIAFHRRFGQRMLERGQLYLALLRLDGVAIAARYDFVFGDRVWCVQGGWDQEYSHLRPGTLMTGEVITWAIGQGLGEYDFLAGEHDYKRRWAKHERGLGALVVANPATARGRLYAEMRSL